MKAFSKYLFACFGDISYFMEHCDFEGCKCPRSEECLVAVINEMAVRGSKLKEAET